MFKVNFILNGGDSCEECFSTEEDICDKLSFCLKITEAFCHSVRGLYRSASVDSLPV